MSARIDAPIHLDHLRDIAHLAGEIMRRHFTPFGMKREVKTDMTPLTVADTEINRLVIDRVRRISAKIDIVGEEESDRTNSPWRIICDPIDGTFPYTWGMPLSTFMIGLTHEGVPIMGVIYDPFTNRMYYAEKGSGAWMFPGVPLTVSSAATQKGDPVVGYVSWPGCSHNILKACQYLEEAGVTLVNLFSIGYMDVAVATGEFAGTFFSGKKHHDTVAGHLIVEEAGGRVSDVLGNPLHYAGDRVDGHIFSNGKIHDLILEAVRASG